MELRELTIALAENKDVRWSNDGYKVYWYWDKICVVFTSNNFNCALSATEVEHCYIKEEEANK